MTACHPRFRQQTVKKKKMRICFLQNGSQLRMESLLYSDVVEEG